MEYCNTRNQSPYTSDRMHTCKQKRKLRHHQRQMLKQTTSARQQHGPGSPSTCPTSSNFGITSNCRVERGRTQTRADELTSKRGSRCENQRPARFDLSKYLETHSIKTPSILFPDASHGKPRIDAHLHCIHDMNGSR